MTWFKTMTRLTLPWTMALALLAGCGDDLDAKLVAAAKQGNTQIVQYLLARVRMSTRGIPGINPPH